MVLLFLSVCEPLDLRQQHPKIGDLLVRLPPVGRGFAGGRGAGFCDCSQAFIGIVDTLVLHLFILHVSQADLQRTSFDVGIRCGSFNVEESNCIRSDWYCGRVGGKTGGSDGGPHVHNVAPLAGIAGVWHNKTRACGRYGFVLVVVAHDGVGEEEEEDIPPLSY